MYNKQQFVIYTHTYVYGAYTQFCLSEYYVYAAGICSAMRIKNNSKKQIKRLAGGRPSKTEVMFPFS